MTHVKWVTAEESSISDDSKRFAQDMVLWHTGFP